jgi:hypothetical protein
MVSKDARRLQLAQSSSKFDSLEACKREVKRLDPAASIVQSRAKNGAWTKMPAKI